MILCEDFQEWEHGTSALRSGRSAQALPLRLSASHPHFPAARSGVSLHSYRYAWAGAGVKMRIPGTIRAAGIGT
jgi:hypothetical protein